MLKQPLWVAGVFIYGVYIAIGSTSCEKAERSVIPITLLGKGVSFLSSKLNETQGTGEISEGYFEIMAKYAKEGIASVFVGKGVCSWPDTNPLAPKALAQIITPQPVVPVTQEQIQFGAPPPPPVFKQR